MFTKSFTKRTLDQRISYYYHPKLYLPALFLPFFHNLITTVIAPGPGRPRQGYSAQSSSTFSMPFLTFSLYQCCTFSSVPLFHFPLSLHLCFLVTLGITLCTFSPASLHNWLPTGSSVISSFHCLLIFPGWLVCSKTGLCPLF